MKNPIVELSKAKYSENVIRKSAYWLSKTCDWELSENNENWLVTFFGENSQKGKTEFSRLLNDQILREAIDKETKNVRRSIIAKVLTDIEKSL